MTATFLILISFTPGLFWLWFFLRLERIHPAPRRLIALTFLWGCLATIPAGLGSYILDAPALLGDWPIDQPEPLNAAIAMLLIVGPVEELAKFGAVRLGAYRSLYFDSAMAGLVYAAAASLGFASLENFLYVLNYGPAVMLLRAPLSTLAHLVFGSIWGQALGQYYISGGRRRLLLIGSLILAAAVHGWFNLMLLTLGPVALLIDLALVAFGGLWVYGAFRKGQRASPFRYRRNYPRVPCESCGTVIMSLHRFCTACGAPVSNGRQALICSYCGNSNRPDAAFCTACGDQLLRR